MEQIEFTIDIDYTLPRYEPNYLDGMLEGWHEATDLEFTITITSGMYIDDDCYGHALTEEQLGEVKKFSLIVS